jgi:hypothetical protein
MKGTRAYLDLCWKYTQIFYSKKLSMLQRVEYAIYVIHILRLWRMYIYNTKGLTLSQKFITRETFQDNILSCHCFMNSVRKMRTNSSDTPLYLEKCRSDCCEKYFSAQGSWQENKRNYNASTMHNVRAKGELAQLYLKVNREGPTWARSKIHRRDWDDEDEEDGEDIDFIVLQSLTDVVIAEAWQSGFDTPKKCLSAMGVK